jgi:hypothetical protein
MSSDPVLNDFMLKHLDVAGGPKPPKSPKP